MTLTELISRAKALKTMHGETLPPIGPARDAWKAEREQLEALIDRLTTRLNESREARQ